MDDSRRKGDNGSIECGIAIVELALILPLLLIITLASLELIRESTSVKIAVQLSREAANLAYRECVNRINSPDEAVECLSLCQQEVMQRARDTIGSNVTVILSYYTTDTAAAPLLWRLAEVGSSVTYPTKYTAATLAPHSYIATKPDQPIVIGEVYVPYTAVIRAVGGFFHNSDGAAYDATIL